eukprot:7121856-Prymnesium_polylepis.1
MSVPRRVAEGTRAARTHSRRACVPGDAAHRKRVPVTHLALEDTLAVRLHALARKPRGGVIPGGRGVGPGRLGQPEADESAGRRERFQHAQPHERLVVTLVNWLNDLGVACGTIKRRAPRRLGTTAQQVSLCNVRSREVPDNVHHRHHGDVGIHKRVAGLTIQALCSDRREHSGVAAEHESALHGRKRRLGTRKRWRAE